MSNRHSAHYSDTFLHYLETPAVKHPDRIWTPRLPLKFGERLGTSHTPLTPAWGIQILEGINHVLFIFAMFIIVLLSSVIAGIYGWRTHNNQTAIAIGPWLTTVQAMAVTMIFF
jgi:hypothetical protein